MLNQKINQIILDKQDEEKIRKIKKGKKMRTFDILAEEKGFFFEKLKKSLSKIGGPKDILTKKLYPPATSKIRQFKVKGPGQNSPALILKSRMIMGIVLLISLFYLYLSLITINSLAAQPINRLPSSETGSDQTAMTAQAKISLRQAISDAWEKNLPLNNLRLEAKGLSIEAQKILRQKLFTLKAAGNYLYKSQTIFLELPAFSQSAGASLPFRIEGGFKHNYDFVLSISQPIFTGGRLSGQASIYRSAELTTSIQATLLAQEIASNLKLLYFEYHRLQARKNSLLAFKEQLNFHEKKMASLVEAELARRLNLLETRMKREEVATSILDLEQAIAAIRADFHRICGHFLDEIQDDFQEPDLNLQEAIAYFEKNHPQLKIYEEKINQLSLQKRIVQANNLPQMVAVAEVHYGRPGLNFFKREWSLYATAGLAINFRLFDWFQDRSEIEKINLEEQKTINERQNFREEVKQELQKLYEQKDILTKKLSHLENITHLAEEEIKIKEELALENLLPHLDYLSSLQAFEQNKWAKEEIRLAIEEIKVKINSLIARNEENR